MTSNWTSIGESPYPWERDAIDFIRSRFPEHEPYRAWSLFEFIALDGSVNEVDPLVFASRGFFLVEIKSRRGRVTDDAGTWTYKIDGRLTSTDNPLKLATRRPRNTPRSSLPRPFPDEAAACPSSSRSSYCRPQTSSATSPAPAARRSASVIAKPPRDHREAWHQNVGEHRVSHYRLTAPLSLTRDTRLWRGTTRLTKPDPDRTI